MKCKLCQNKIEGYGNNGEPIVNGRVCDNCNEKFVIKARLEIIERARQE